MRLSKASAVPFLVFALCLVLVVGAFGQAGTTSVFGEVTDEQGAVIVGATVTVTHRGTGAIRTTRTDSSGRYEIRGLQPGKYNIKIEASGFTTVLNEKLDLAVDTPTRFPIGMKVGAAAETVEVVAAAVAVNTSDASVGNAITQAQIQQLPVEGLNVVHLLSLQPGAIFLAEPSANDPRSGSISGARADQINVTLDGVDVNDPQLQTAYTSVLRQTPDSVQEFKVTTTNYTAESGRSSGAQVSLVTKSGTNEYHGSAYWSHRNTVFSSNEYFHKLFQLDAGEPNEQPLLQKHLFGASLGGPVIKDRLFLFGTWSTIDEKREFSAQRDIPSMTMRDGVLLYQCANAASCPGGSVSGLSNSHTVPAGFYGLTPAELAGLDPLGIGVSLPAMAFFQQYPIPNATGNNDRLNFLGFSFGAGLKNKLTTYIARADFKVDPNGNHSVFARGNLQDDIINGTPQFPDSPGPNSTQQGNSRGLAFGYTGVFGPRVVNNFRYGFTRLGVASAGLRDTNLSTFRFLDHYPFATNSFTNGRVAGTHNFLDDVSWIVGQHTVQFGANLRYTRIPRFDNASSFHTATANGSWVSGVGQTYIPGRPECTTATCNAVPAVSSGSFGSFGDTLINMLGIMSQASARYNYDRDGNPLPVGEPIRRTYGSNEYEFYLQDNWRVRPNFVLNFGVRYSYFSPPWEVNGFQVAPTVSMGERFNQRVQNMLAGIPSNASPLLTFDLSGPVNGGRGFYEKDYNNWAPRFGFAWTPQFDGGVLGALTGNGKMVLRGGYSMVYDRIGQGLALAFDQGGSFGMSTSLTSPFGVFNEDDPTIRFQGTTVIPPHLPPAPPGGFPTTPPVAAGIITQTIDDTIVTPYSQSFTLSVGREMPWRSSLEVGYVGRVGRRLLVRRDLAMPLNLVDSISGMDYYTAARLVIEAGASAPSSAAANFAGIPNIPYWENMFPNAGAFGMRGLTNTQEIARRFWIDSPDYITSLWLFDQFCVTTMPATSRRACSKFGPFAYFDQQYDFVAGSSSVGDSNYHAMNFTWRKRPSHGVQFDLNYTMAKSMDNGSSVERGFGTGTNFANGGYTGFWLNPFDPRKHWAQSDFDVRHQVNVNWIFELPFGRGRSFGGDMNGVANAIVGGWQVAGIWRWTSGFPLNVFNCRSCWPTNWNLQGNAGLFPGAGLPETGTTHHAVGGLNPSPFPDPIAAAAEFRQVFPGEVGLRNVLRGDGYFGIDLGIGKDWTMPYHEGHRLRFRWDIFNMTNTARFDVSGLTAFPDRVSSFGSYNQTLSTCDRAAGRCMQLGLRYEF